MVENVRGDEVWSTHLVSICSKVYPLYVYGNLDVTEWSSLDMQDVKEVCPFYRLLWAQKVVYRPIYYLPQYGNPSHLFGVSMVKVDNCTCSIIIFRVILFLGKKCRPNWVFGTIFSRKSIFLIYFCTENVISWFFGTLWRHISHHWLGMLYFIWYHNV